MTNEAAYVPDEEHIVAVRDALIAAFLSGRDDETKVEAQYSVATNLLRAARDVPRVRAAFAAAIGHEGCGA